MKFHLILIILVFLSCTKDPSTPVIKSNLGDYLEENSAFGLVKDSLIACAVGGENVLLTTPDFPISILFYPKGDASDFRYFETENGNVDPSDYSNYEYLELNNFPVFNGYLRGFERPETDDRWGLVTYLKDGELNISNPIRIKYQEKPTEDNPSLLEVNSVAPLSPLFTWSDGMIDENVIFFQVVLDKNGNLLSGTYTLQNQFQFYDLSNVVLNITAMQQAPNLSPNEEYTFVLMGVSEDVIAELK